MTKKPKALYVFANESHPYWIDYRNGDVSDPPYELRQLAATLRTSNDDVEHGRVTVGPGGATLLRSWLEKNADAKGAFEIAKLKG